MTKTYQECRIENKEFLLSQMDKEELFELMRCHINRKWLSENPVNTYPINQKLITETLEEFLENW